MIDKYSFGSIVVDGVSYHSDIKIIDGKVISNWWRREGHSICKEDVEDVIRAKPEVFIMGTGCYGILKIPGEFQKLMESLNIELVAEKTDKACTIYNELSKNKRVSFGAHLTC